MITVPVIADTSEFIDINAFLSNDFPKQSYCQFTLSESGIHYRRIYCGASISGVNIYRTDNVSEAVSIFGVPSDSRVCYYLISSNNFTGYSPQHYVRNGVEYLYNFYTSSPIVLEGVYVTCIYGRNDDFISVEYIGEYSTIPVIASIYDVIIRRYPITYRLTNATTTAPNEAAVGDTVTVPLTFPEGYGVVNPTTDAYVTCNGVLVPSTYSNGQLVFTMPDPS